MSWVRHTCQSVSARSEHTLRGQSVSVLKSKMKSKIRNENENETSHPSILIFVLFCPVSTYCSMLLYSTFSCLSFFSFILSLVMFFLFPLFSFFCSPFLSALFSLLISSPSFSSPPLYTTLRTFRRTCVGQAYRCDAHRSSQQIHRQRRW